MRKVDKLGPYGMWSKLLHLWGDKMSPQQVYEKVRFFLYATPLFIALSLLS